MPILTIPDDIYQQLTERAAALHVTVEDFVRLNLHRLAQSGAKSIDPDPTSSDEDPKFRDHLLNFPKFDGDFLVERDRDCGREIEL